jgi:hypothetical protein
MLRVGSESQNLPVKGMVKTLAIPRDQKPSNTLPAPLFFGCSSPLHQSHVAHGDLETIRALKFTEGVLSEIHVLLSLGLTE